MSRGAVTAYVRIPAQRQAEGIRRLKEAGYVAERDDGDPDRPIGTADLYVEQHYGILARVQEWPRGKHDGLVARQALNDRDAIIVHRSDLDRPALDLILAVDDVDIIALVVA